MMFDWLLVTRNVKHVESTEIDIVLYSDITYSTLRCTMPPIHRRISEEALDARPQLRRSSQRCMLI